MGRYYTEHIAQTTINTHVHVHSISSVLSFSTGLSSSFSHNRPLFSTILSQFAPDMRPVKFLAVKDVRTILHILCKYHVLYCCMRQNLPKHAMKKTNAMLHVAVEAITELEEERLLLKKKEMLVLLR